MNLTHIKYFHDAIECGSLHKAALRNFVTPGAVSQAILKLEEIYQLKLLSHGKNRLVVTEQGKLLYSLCPALLNHVDLIEEQMKSALNPFSGKIYFGTQQSLASSVLPLALKKFNDTHPEVEVSFNIGHSSYMLQILKDKQIDLVISMNNVDFKKFEKIVLFKGEFILLSSKSSNNKHRGYLTTSGTPEVLDLKKHYLNKTGQALPVKMEIDSWGVIKQMALDGVGIGFIPDYLITERERKFIHKSSLPKINYEVCAFFRKDTELNLKTKKFLDYFIGRNH